MSRTAWFLLGWGVFSAVIIGTVLAVSWPAPAILLDGRRARTFYIPSESMRPALNVDDRIRPLRVSSSDLTRGQVVVFNTPQSVRVDRIVAVAGDEVSMTGGRLTINGHMVEQRSLGTGPTMSDGTRTTMWSEQLPGEAGRHRVLDTGETEMDTFGPVRVPTGRLFMLGDNRDLAADSRFPPEQLGVGMVSKTDVIGEVDRLLWAKGLKRAGAPIDAPDERR